MKQILSLLLALCLLLSLAACGAAPAETSAPTTEPVETTEAPFVPPTGKDALRDKKIIFIGNSYTFWGQTVIKKEKNVLLQSDRSNDHGYFYQLCKANGLEVAVTNWTYGGHDITNLFDGPCDMGHQMCIGEYHDRYLQDAWFDYVCIQPYKEKDFSGDITTHLDYTMDFFRDVNPNVQFLLLVPQMAPEDGYTWYSQINKLHDKKGVTICNWGGMLHDISQGDVAVPGATLEYARSSFVVSNDDHHENLLAGYITTLMVYCAITGESAVGQPYDFCNDSTLDPLFDFEAFNKKNYKDGATNYVEIFGSEADMKGLQQLVDQYLTDFN